MIPALIITCIWINMLVMSWRNKSRLLVQPFFVCLILLWNISGSIPEKSYWCLHLYLCVLFCYFVIWLHLELMRNKRFCWSYTKMIDTDHKVVYCFLNYDSRTVSLLQGYILVTKNSHIAVMVYQNYHIIINWPGLTIIFIYLFFYKLFLDSKLTVHSEGQ